MVVTIGIRRDSILVLDCGSDTALKKFQRLSYTPGSPGSQHNLDACREKSLPVISSSPNTAIRNKFHVLATIY